MTRKTCFFATLTWFAFSIIPADTLAEDKSKGMAKIPAGEFVMGSEIETDEKPPHKVHVDAFMMDTHEVTQAEYEKVMGNNPSKFKGPDRPVEMVTWKQAKEYCGKLGKDLPTEAEWEWAARGGTNTKFPWGDEVGKNNANCKDCGSQWDWKETSPVGSFKPNGYGLFDMIGNVREWVLDVYAPYTAEPQTNPKGPGKGKHRGLRGGSWYHLPKYSRVTSRFDGFISFRHNYDGFRCVKRADM